ncbi:divergent PAP2 family protein [Candidatus Saccharibacteria bacterium]|nr:divergent PAP2 family protein [Candidatus Saccharibacteria bacterium]
MNNSGTYAIIAFIFGFIIAQGIKFLIGFFGKDKRGRYQGIKGALKSLGRSGGMPSGHSSSFSALSIFLGLSEGFSSTSFAISFAMAVIIIYDAVNVRRAVGEHGKLLNEIAISDGNDKTNPQKLVEGHTIFQAVIGILMGILIGYLTFLAYQTVEFAKN